MPESDFNTPNDVKAFYLADPNNRKQALLDKMVSLNMQDETQFGQAQSLIYTAMWEEPEIDQAFVEQLYGKFKENISSYTNEEQIDLNTRFLGSDIPTKTIALYSLAINKDHKPIFDFFTENGADPNCYDAEKSSVLHWAAFLEKGKSTKNDWISILLNDVQLKKETINYSSKVALWTMLYELQFDNAKTFIFDDAGGFRDGITLDPDDLYKSALEINDANIIRFLLENKITTEDPNLIFESALLLGDEKQIRECLENEALDLNKGSLHPNISSLLERAIKSANIPKDIVEIMLEKGATSSNEELLYKNALQINNVDIIRLLYKHDITPQDPNLQFEAALATGDVAQLQACLEADNALDLNSGCEHPYFNSLLERVFLQNISGDIVLQMLEKGANPNIKTHERYAKGISLLDMNIVQNKNVALSKALIEGGANISSITMSLAIQGNQFELAEYIIDQMATRNILDKQDGQGKNISHHLTEQIDKLKLDTLQAQTQQVKLAKQFATPGIRSLQQEYQNTILENQERIAKIAPLIEQIKLKQPNISNQANYSQSEIITKIMLYVDAYNTRNPDDAPLDLPYTEVDGWCNGFSAVWAYMRTDPDLEEQGSQKDPQLFFRLLDKISKLSEEDLLKEDQIPIEKLIGWVSMLQSSKDARHDVGFGDKQRDLDFALDLNTTDNIALVCQNKEEVKQLLEEFVKTNPNKFVSICSPDHAMAIIYNEEKDKYLFYDPNHGVGNVGMTFEHDSIIEERFSSERECSIDELVDMLPDAFNSPIETLAVELTVFEGCTKEQALEKMPECDKKKTDFLTKIYANRKANDLNMDPHYHKVSDGKEREMNNLSINQRKLEFGLVELNMTLEHADVLKDFDNTLSSFAREFLNLEAKPGECSADSTLPEHYQRQIKGASEFMGRYLETYKTQLTDKVKADEVQSTINKDFSLMLRNNAVSPALLDKAIDVGFQPTEDDLLQSCKRALQANRLDILENNLNKISNPKPETLAELRGYLSHDVFNDIDPNIYLTLASKSKVVTADELPSIIAKVNSEDPKAFKKVVDLFREKAQMPAHNQVDIVSSLLHKHAIKTPAALEQFANDKTYYISSLDVLNEIKNGTLQIEIKREDLNLIKNIINHDLIQEDHSISSMEKTKIEEVINKIPALAGQKDELMRDVEIQELRNDKNKGKISKEQRSDLQKQDALKFIKNPASVSPRELLSDAKSSVQHSMFKRLAQKSRNRSAQKDSSPEMIALNDLKTKWMQIVATAKENGTEADLGELQMLITNVIKDYGEDSKMGTLLSNIQETISKIQPKEPDITLQEEPELVQDRRSGLSK